MKALNKIFSKDRTLKENHMGSEITFATQGSWELNTGSYINPASGLSNCQKALIWETGGPTIFCFFPFRKIK